jgi:hypothetical protein
MRRAIEGNVLERFLECGDLHCGFARIRCGGCGHDLLLAFSCKTRYFCPSCHQKRVLTYGDWVESSVLRPVPHRQYVFTVPRLLRPFFAYRRSLLGELCRIIARALSQAYSAAHPRARPGFILFVQTFGDLARQAANAAWAKLIRKVYEVDPLLCPKCGTQMRVIALLEEPAVIERILSWLGLWQPLAACGPSPPEGRSNLPLTYHPIPDVA